MSRGRGRGGSAGMPLSGLRENVRRCLFDAAYVRPKPEIVAELARLHPLEFRTRAELEYGQSCHLAAYTDSAQQATGPSSSPAGLIQLPTNRSTMSDSASDFVGLIHLLGDSHREAKWITKGLLADPLPADLGDDWSIADSINYSPPSFQVSLFNHHYAHPHYDSFPKELIKFGRSLERPAIPNRRRPASKRLRGVKQADLDAQVVNQQLLSPSAGVGESGDTIQLLSRLVDQDNANQPDNDDEQQPTVAKQRRGALDDDEGQEDANPIEPDQKSASEDEEEEVDDYCEAYFDNGESDRYLMLMGAGLDDTGECDDDGGGIGNEYE